MHHLIFVNLPVADLGRSRRFFTELGYRFDERFCDDENALCLVLGERQYAMLLRTERFGDFTPLPVADAHTASEVLLCLSADSREQVDELVGRAVELGGTDVRTEDYGFMYGRSYADPDGHIWEIMWMDPRAAEQGCPESAGQSVGQSAGDRVRDVAHA